MYAPTLSALALAIVPVLAAAPQAQTANYSVLYTEDSDSASFNVEVVRGMALAGNDLFAINSYASSLLRYDLGAITNPPPQRPIRPQQTWPTLVDPVALAVYNGGVYVLGQGHPRPGSP